MITEKSSGAVVFHRGEQIEYLLLLSNFWGFPKGHIEAGENEREAALREIREETGLEVTLVKGFRAVDEYWYQRQGARVRKQAIFFLAAATHRASKISWEHLALVWLPFDQAMERVKYENLREILTMAQAFLVKHQPSP